MDEHDIQLDSHCNLRLARKSVEDLQESHEKSRSLIFQNSLPFLGQSDSNAATSQHRNEKEPIAKKRRIEMKPVRANRSIISSWENLYPFREHHRRSSEHAVNRGKPSLQEHRTTTLSYSKTSATTLCSISASSCSTLKKNTVLRHNQKVQNLHSDSYNKIHLDTKKFVVEAIRERFLPLLKNTGLKPKRDKIMALKPNDVIPARPNVLGIGTFSRVTRIALRGATGARKDKNKKYACKQLKQELLSNPQDYVKAATELAYEAYIMSSLDHQNIVKLKGLAADGIASFGSVANDTQEGPSSSSSFSCNVDPPATSFFLIMDILQETLDQRIERWNTVAQPKTLAESRQRSIEKISLCRQLASVLEYIHSKGVVYRDLKPQNIGFCRQEGYVLKLFDFGLSRELPLSIVRSKKSEQSVYNPNEHMRFKLSGMVGTIRYMAPEVCLSQPYNRDCDIYSWSIVSWEIWSQTKPFANFTPDLYEILVCRQGFRPTDEALNYDSRNKDLKNEIPNHTKFYYSSEDIAIPPDLEILLKEAWRHEPHQRMRWSAIQSHLDVFQEWMESTRDNAIVGRNEVLTEYHGIKARYTPQPDTGPIVVSPDLCARKFHRQVFDSSGFLLPPRFP